MVTLLDGIEVPKRIPTLTLSSSLLLRAASLLHQASSFYHGLLGPVQRRLARFLPYSTGPDHFIQLEYFRLPQYSQGNVTP